MHLISSITEWVTALLFVVYFLSFYKEFDQIAFELHVKKKTHAALPFEVSSEDRAAPLLAWQPEYWRTLSDSVEESPHTLYGALW